MKQNKTLKNNLTALQTINPVISKWLQKQEDVDWVQEIQSANGAKNLLITSGSKRENAFSMEDPMREARKAAKEIQLFKENVTILIGFGLGYIVKAMLARAEKGHRILVVEPVGHMIRLAFGNFNFSKALLNGSLLIIAPGPDEISFALGFLDSQFVISDWALTVNKYINWRQEDYAKLMKHTNDILGQLLCNVGTVAGPAGAKIGKNDIECLPFVIRHRGIIELKDLYKGKPAILVSTGPSLAKNIHHLIGLEDRAVIIAVGQALRVLLGYGIRPDFIATVDFGNINYEHFSGILDCDIPLVTINRAYSDLLKQYQGPKFIVGTPVPGAEKTAAGILTEKGFLESGGSVAHLVLSFSMALGCRPLIMIGQDLALSDGSHFGQADAGGKVNVTPDGVIKWEVTDPGSSLHGRDDLSMGAAVFVDGYWGKPVLTNIGLASFLTSFTGMIERYLKED